MKIEVELPEELAYDSETATKILSRVTPFYYELTESYITLLADLAGKGLLDKRPDEDSDTIPTSVLPAYGTRKALETLGYLQTGTTGKELESFLQMTFTLVLEVMHNEGRCPNCQDGEHPLAKFLK